MTSPAPIYEGECLLVRWGESSTAGRTITLQIEAEGQHQFKGYEHERFTIVIVPIGNDQKPTVLGDAPAREDGDRSQAMSVSAPSVAAASSPSAKYAPPSWPHMKPAARAAVLCKMTEFWEWLDATTTYEGELTTVIKAEILAIIELKNRLGVKSRAEIVEGSPAAAELSRIIGNYNAWRQARGHGATT